MKDPDQPRRLLKQMVMIRRFEEKCAELYQVEKIRGFLHLYIGEEAVATGVIDTLEAGDAVVATYREHGHALALGVEPGRILAEMYGKAEGVSMGRGGSMHLFDADTRLFGGNAIVGGGLPVAVGLALADKLKGNDRVTAVFFGEGAVAEGEFHESMNLAALWRLPVLFCCENNLYAMGTALNRAQTQMRITLKASAYEMPAWEVDGMDVLAVSQAATRAVESIRGGAGPHFLELRTYRFRAHSMFDPELYRDKDEVNKWKLRDPIETFRTMLEADAIVTSDEFAAIEAEVAVEIDAAVAFAEAGTLEPIHDLTRFVHSEEVAR
ncbi:MAG: pyruvate dehydrogenase (acetyl-transferring) E1 component subunit alpha [Actinomycetia bacterium]|nr:pyruvate dehydrogenase (acetyl-transferring) E1 component subunit alpha [Actinomycetes bacterium]